ALLYFALRNAPLTEIWSTLRQLQLWQIAALAGINAGIYALVTLRWWIITQAEAKRVPYLPLLFVRVAVFGVSYFTLGPQVGGEPLQVLALRQRYGLTYTRATATVLMDKLLEFLANFILLALGLTAILEAGMFSTNGSRSIVSLIGMVLLLAWPPVHILLMRGGRHPIASILRMFPKNKTTRFIIASERMAGAFCRRHLKALLAAILVSLLAALGMVSEYFLITSFLHVELNTWQTVAAWTMNWLAFLVPWPGGLGALEASQVFALGAFGVSAASAIGVTLLIRARDIFIGGLGILLAGRGVTK
ncbi:MAG TPA: lysylphosphatidylglycerol synthase transmembrane domain-containing protein, partial [Anaerolineales bacterium]|nr:lysylphosphatidylglycerol synthase transmembrane domain-containing protein [Anaerolineales bacterium]